MSNALAVCVVFSIGLTACTADYRTDYERNNGIVLTASEVQDRKEMREAREAMQAEWMRRDADEFRLQRAYWDCWNRNIVECL